MLEHRQDSAVQEGCILDAKKLDLLIFLPPSETGDTHTPVSDQGDCPPPPLALPAQDSVPRYRRHIARDTAQGGGAKPFSFVLSGKCSLGVCCAREFCCKILSAPMAF